MAGTAAAAPSTESKAAKGSSWSTDAAAGCCCCRGCCWGVLLTGPNMSSRSNPAAAVCTAGDGGPELLLCCCTAGLSTGGGVGDRAIAAAGALGAIMGAGLLMPPSPAKGSSRPASAVLLLLGEPAAILFADVGLEALPLHPAIGTGGVAGSPFALAPAPAAAGLCGVAGGLPAMLAFCSAMVCLPSTPAMMSPKGSWALLPMMANACSFLLP